MTRILQSRPALPSAPAEIEVELTALQAALERILLWGVWLSVMLVIYLSARIRSQAHQVRVKKLQ